LKVKYGMKKIFLSLTLISFAISGFCQLIKPVKIDSLVTISLPQGFQKKDTTDRTVFSANALYGFMIVVREPNAKNNTPLKKEKDLNKVLKTYINGIQRQSDGSSVQNVRDTTVGALKAKTFTLKTDDGGGDIQYRNFVLLYTQDATYTFEYVYPDNRKDLVKDEYKSYISSIRLSPELQRNDQYLSNTTGMATITKIEILGGSALVIILVIVLIAKRKRRIAIS
jgi:hypothetical protein